MAENSELEALKKFSTEIDDSQMKIIYSAQCVKAQEHLTNNLKKSIDQTKERCSFMCTTNMKLQADISQAQREICSLHLAQKTINNANVELKKELLKAEEEKLELSDRIKKGEKKYGDLWVESKARYESLPHVQRLLKAKNEKLYIDEQIDKLESDKNIVIEEIRKKNQSYRVIDRERAIKLAEYMTIERPKIIELIKEKSHAIQVLENELKKEENIADNNDHHKEETKANNQLIMPRLQLDYSDFDSLNINMEKINSDDIRNTSHNSSYSIHSVIVIDPTKTTKKNKTPNIDQHYYSTFFYNPNNGNEANKTQNYDMKKLINILEDIKIDPNETQRILADVNPEVLQPVETIAANDSQHPGGPQSKNYNIAEIGEVEEIDLTASNYESLVKPPSQFLDASLEPQASQKEQEEAIQDETPVPVLKTSQAEAYKKQVTFDLSHVEEPKNDDENIVISGEVSNANESKNSQLDVNDETYANMKDMIMKKHNLDLSPQFVYAKNAMAPKMPGDSVVTSKFFPQEQTQKNDSEIIQNNDEQIKEANVANSSTKEKHTTEIKVSSPKTQMLTEIQPLQLATGFMFGASPLMSTVMEDESMNATGYEDGEFSGIDSSLLLSPKNNISMQLESQEVMSQDVPNFLSGLKKSGLSLFGCMGSTDLKPDSSAQTQSTSGFTFNFGSDEKKNRGGLFSMFSK